MCWYGTRCRWRYRDDVMEDRLLQAFKRTGLAKPNELQTRYLALTKKNNESLLIAPTGSGKTLAYLLNALRFLSNEKRGVLILCPSRELAIQIHDVFKSLKTDIKSLACYGGHNMESEVRSLANDPRLIIGTPGRIIDHIEREQFPEWKEQLLILDEYDKCLEFGFESQISDIASELRNRIQTSLISATKLDHIPKHILSNDHEELELTSNQGNIEEFLIEGRDGFEELVSLVNSFGATQSMIFVNYREVADDIADRLYAQGINAESYHGGLEQNDRERITTKFDQGSILHLVCTDLGARGLDFESMEHVIHQQYPSSEDAYQHRNGRTGRQGAKGNVYFIREMDNDLPEYIGELSPKKIHHNNRPSEAKWQTIYIGAGKKDKISKGDILGFLIRKGGVKGDQVGKIHVFDRRSYVAIDSKIDNLVRRVYKEKIKGKRIKIALSK